MPLPVDCQVRPPLLVERLADAAGLGAIIEDRRLLDLYVYWMGLDALPRLPSRAEIEPLDFARLWPFLILAELVGPHRRILYRVVGTEIVHQWGYDFTGRYMDEIAHGAQKALMEALYALVAEARAPVYAHTRLQLDGTRDGAMTRRIMLPLADDGVNVDQVLIGQTTRWTSDTTNELIALELGNMTQLVQECHAWVPASQAAASPPS